MRAKILVEDDDVPSCELISEILRSAGFDAVPVTSSAEAAERLKEEKFHAVILGMRMPSPDWLALARAVRASRINAPSVTVMITGEQERTVMKRAFEIQIAFSL